MAAEMNADIRNFQQRSDFIGILYLKTRGKQRRMLCQILMTDRDNGLLFSLGLFKLSLNPLLSRFADRSRYGFTVGVQQQQHQIFGNRNKAAQRIRILTDRLPVRQILIDCGKLRGADRFHAPGLILTE